MYRDCDSTPALSLQVVTPMVHLLYEVTSDDT